MPKRKISGTARLSLARGKGRSVRSVPTVLRLADEHPMLDVDAWADEYVRAVAESIGLTRLAHVPVGTAIPLKKAG